MHRMGAGRTGESKGKRRKTLGFVLWFIRGFPVLYPCFLRRHRPRSAPGLMQRALTDCSRKLFYDESFFKPVAGVEQDTMGDVGFGADLDTRHIGDGAGVGIGTDRAFFGVDHLKPHDGGFGE